MISFAAGLVIGVIGTVIYNHFFSSKVAALGDTIVEKVDPLKK